MLNMLRYNLSICRVCGDIHSNWEPCPYARWQLPAAVMCEITLGHVGVVALLALALGVVIGMGLGVWWCP